MIGAALRFQRFRGTFDPRRATASIAAVLITATPPLPVYHKACSLVRPDMPPMACATASRTLTGGS